VWAILEDDLVTGYLVGLSEKELSEEIASGKVLVEMTIENSPAVIGGRFDGQKFYGPGE
jgi:hypothetical protein